MPHRAPSPRTEIRRKPQRGHYDRATIDAIVDAAVLCHIAFAHGGSVHCLPTACWRDGDYLYIHGANNSRMVQALLEAECSVAITHLDGLVLARSAFHHSMNFRSVVIYGRFAAVDEPAPKATAFRQFVDHVSPGRAAQVREPSPAELAGTRLLRIPLAEAAAKVRNWGVEEAAEDLAVPVWAGVIPLALRAGAPERDPVCESAVVPPRPAWLAE